MLTAIQQLCDQAAHEFNWLLTEPPFLVPGGLDFGWYCREHAYCTAVVGALLGLPCQTVRGDFLVLTARYERLTSIGTPDDHAWCRTIEHPVFDLSLQLQHILQRPEHAAPIIGLGRHGAFDVRILPATTLQNATFGGAAIIGYIPRRVFHWSALELVETPQILLPTAESAEISALVALHTHRVITLGHPSLIGVLPQREALAQLRRTIPKPSIELRRLLMAC